MRIARASTVLLFVFCTTACNSALPSEPGQGNAMARESALGNPGQVRSLARPESYRAQTVLPGSAMPSGDGGGMMGSGT